MEIFYTSPASIQAGMIRLTTQDEVRHITRVLRYQPGDHILVVDGEGNEYRCVITQLGRREVLAEVISRTRRAREPIAEVTLAPAALKGNNLDLVVEMATELGISQLVPLITGRTVARVTPARLERFRKKAVAALKSSTRTLLPRLKPAQEFEQFLSESTQYDLKLIAYEEERQSRLNDVLTHNSRRVALVIGPEGGFAASEVASAREAGFRPFSLGPRRLRAETACIAALSMLLYQLREI